MKTEFKTKDLREGFSALSGVCPARSPKPILSHLRLRAKDGRFSLEATDLEIWARRSWEGDRAKGLDVLLPAASVGGILKEVDDETVVLEEKDKGIEIWTRDTRVKLPKAPVGEFPDWPDTASDASFQMPAGQVTTALRRVSFAAALEKSRYALNGVMVALFGKTVEWVATDGRRLALARAVGVSAEGEGKAIWSLKMAATAERLLSDTSAAASVTFDRRFARIATRDVEVAGRLVEGAYPDYKSVVPKGLPERLTARSVEFEKGVRKASLMTAAGAGSVGLRIADGAVEVSGQSPEDGEIKVTVKARYGGRDLQIRFNPRFLLDAFRAAGEREEIEVELKDATSPALFHLADDAFYVVLPVHVVS